MSFETLRRRCGSNCDKHIIQTSEEWVCDQSGLSSQIVQDLVFTGYNGLPSSDTLCIHLWMSSCKSETWKTLRMRKVFGESCLNANTCCKSSCGNFKTCPWLNKYPSRRLHLKNKGFFCYCCCRRFCNINRIIKVCKGFVPSNQPKRGLKWENVGTALAFNFEIRSSLSAKTSLKLKVEKTSWELKVAKGKLESKSGRIVA